MLQANCLECVKDIRLSDVFSSLFEGRRRWRRPSPSYALNIPFTCTLFQKVQVLRRKLGTAPGRCLNRSAAMYPHICTMQCPYACVDLCFEHSLYQFTWRRSFGASWGLPPGRCSKRARPQLCTCTHTHATNMRACSDTAAWLRIVLTHL